MNVVVDSNAVFIAILNSKSKIGRLLISGSRFFSYYSLGLLKQEITEHREKIIQVAGFTELQFQASFDLITAQIQFIDDVLLSEEGLKMAVDLVSDIDIEDAPFVALNNHLLTGDKKLIRGLKRKGYSRILTTDFCRKNLRLGRDKKTKC